jgi:hypothetical protein
MPRSSGRSGFGGRSSGGGSYSRSSSAGRQTGYTANRAGTYTTSPPQSSYQRPMSPVGTGGLGSTIAHGMAFGGGSAVAHHAIGSMLGRGPYGSREEVARREEVSSTIPSESAEPLQNTQMQTNPCIELNSKFIECLKGNKDDISKCQNVLNDVLSCEKTYFS